MMRNGKVLKLQWFQGFSPFYGKKKNHAAYQRISLGYTPGYTPKRLYGVYDLAEIIQINILIISQHFGACVADQFHFILIRGNNLFHERRECMAAGMRRIFVEFIYDRVFDADRLQGRVKNRITKAIIQKCAAFIIAEQRARRTPGSKAAYDRLNLRADRDDAVFTGCRFRAAGKRFVFGIIAIEIQSQKLGRAEAEIAQI